MLEKGFYSNVDVGELNAFSDDLSTLTKENRLGTSSGMYWRAPNDNWVFEEDLVLGSGITAPILPSGVTINGTFYASSHATYGHVFDFDGGGVVFTSGTVPSGTVKCAHSYREFAVRIADRTTSLSLMNDYFVNDGIDDVAQPSGISDFPAIYVDAEGGEVKPLAVGGGIIVRKRIGLHIVFPDRLRDAADDIADFLSYMAHHTIKLIDIDLIPESLDWRGAKASTYVSYNSMLNDASYFWNHAYCLRSEPVYLDSERKNWNRIRIDTLWEIRGVPR